MKEITINNLYYKVNETINEYKDVFIDTNHGLFKINHSSLDIELFTRTNQLKKINELEILKAKYGILYLTSCRRTYDNNIYLLISDKFLLVIEYVLNSTHLNSTREFRIVENLNSINIEELKDFHDLEIIPLPNQL